jgi:acyl-coenzyme A thioesterase PaaI-like protein
MPDPDPAPRALYATPRNDGVDAAVVAARRVVASLVLSGNGTEAEMAAVAAKLNGIADHLEQHAPAPGQRLVDMWAGEGITRHDPVTGPENALAPPLQLVGQADGSVSAAVRLGLPYQGPPGCVHGGISALLLDHALGVANAFAGTSGMTGTLTLRYHRPVPLFEEVTVSGHQVKVEGRKITAVGTICRGSEVLVNAEGTFIDTHLPRPR